MSLHRPLVLGLILALVATAGHSAASEFAQKLAAWQGGAPPAPMAEAPPIAVPSPAAPPAQTRTTPPSSNLRPYPPQPSGHIPGCTTCGHGPGFIGPSHDGLGGCGMGGNGCGPLGCGLLGGYCHGGGDCCDDSPSCCQTLVWARFEVLMWWRQGRDHPPLVTTDPVNEDSTTAGILPDAEILFGGDRIGSNMQAGGRFDVGWWTDPRQCWGIGWRFYGLGQDGTGFGINSLQNPVLAIPFVDAAANSNEALLVAYPGLRSGSIAIDANSEVLGNDVYGRFLICRDCDSRLDFITGWHMSRINDSLTIRSSSTVTEVGGNIPIGTMTDIRDDFRARNEFHGGILGLLWERDCGCWNTQLLARMALGSMYEETSIRGSTSIAVPGLPVDADDSGLFAADSNSGTFTRSEFTAVTEVGLRLGYRWNPCTQLTVGYTFIYWNDVVNAPDAIDTSVGTSAGGERPRFAFDHSDFWVQGINLGFVREF